MSTEPKASTAAATSSSAAPVLVRSPAKTAVLPPSSEAACWATSASRSLISTFAPSATNSSAVARPMPRAEPVTIAALPSRSPTVSPLLAVKVGAEPIWTGAFLARRPVSRGRLSEGISCPPPSGVSECRRGRRLQHLPVVAARDVQPDPAGGGDRDDAAAGPEAPDHRLPPRRLPLGDGGGPCDRLLPQRRQLGNGIE